MILVLHCQIFECLLSLKKNLIGDLLAVIAHGPPNVRAPAAGLLLHYWPGLSPTTYDRRDVHVNFTRK